ncbi:MAG: tetratricopeptide repeat protein [Candidatus Zixiibacteriota bacterium]
MPGCGNKKFEDFFHAYELGMLSDADRGEFEMHLMVCEACFDDAQKLAEATHLVRRDGDVRAVIEEVADVDTGGEVSNASQVKQPFNYKRLWQSLVPSLIVLGLLIVMIIQPWQVDIRPSQDAVATQNRLAIMYFENLADPQDEQRLGDIITSLLITDLSESQYMSVISSQRLYDIARTLGKEGRSGLDKETALEIARRADAKWMLLGSIHQSDPYYSIAGQLVDVATGDVIASQLTAGEPGENIFALVDKLTVEIKNDLALPREAGNELDPMVADVTTHSAEAYKNYLLGMESYRKLYVEEAKGYLEKAVEEDSTFAMAYYYLSHTVSSMSALSDKYMDLALKYLDKVNQKERYYILAKEAADNADYKMGINYLEKVLVRYPDEKEALFLIGNYYYAIQDLKQATEYFEKVAELDPFSKLAFNMLAYCYFALGEYDKAIENADKYVAMAPNEANPFDTRGEILARMGRMDEAIESYKKAVQIRRDFASSGLALIYLNLYQRNYAEAERYSREFAANGVASAESKSSLYDACIYVFEGMTDKALTTLDKYLDKDKEDQSYSLLGDKYYLKAAIYSEMGQADKAIKNVRRARETMLTSNSENTLAYRHYEIQFLAKGGRFEEAEKLLQEYQREINGINLRLARYHYCSGTIAYERGDYARAIKEFEESLSVRDEFSYMTTYMLAMSYFKTDNYAKAIHNFERLFKDVSLWRLFYGIQDSRVHYYLGIAYEESGKLDMAAKWYEKFLDIWENADSSWTELDDARMRLARLKSRSELN